RLGDRAADLVRVLPGATRGGVGHDRRLDHARRLRGRAARVPLDRERQHRPPVAADARGAGRAGAAGALAPDRAHPAAVPRAARADLGPRPARPARPARGDDAGPRVMRTTRAESRVMRTTRAESRVT